MINKWEGKVRKGEKEKVHKKRRTGEGVVWGQTQGFSGLLVYKECHRSSALSPFPSVAHSL